MKILFVDDDEKILSSLKRNVRGAFEAATANDPLQALELVRSQGPFAVIVSDLKMPGMNGIEFLSEVKEVSPDTVRILLTGYADFENAVNAVNQGYIFRFLSKPCPPDMLNKAVQDGIEQYRLIQSRHEMHSLQKYRRLMEDIVEGLSSLVEARDPYTGGHQRRVALLAKAIAEAMGLPSDRVEALYITGMLHDIGKVYVPSDFLNKPGILSEQEFSIIKAHPEVGAEIFQNIDFDWPINDFIRQHHERMDGSGYPDGLRGEGIHLEARILAVADVVDAMVSRRPYREGLGLGSALDEIRENAGTLYDPGVVECFLELVENQKDTISELLGVATDSTTTN